MAITHLKTAKPEAERAEDDAKVRAAVESTLKDIEARGDAAVRALSEKFDNYSPPAFRLTESEIEAAMAQVSDREMADIRFAQDQIRTFAEAQRASMTDIEVETLPGVILGHRNIPVQSVGCYVPGGKFPMVASAHMSVLTASVAGVPRIVAAAPPVDGAPHPAIVAAMKLGGAHEIYCLGGIQAVGAMAIGTETIEPVHMLVGPGNAFVAEAKRQLFGRVGIDMVAGPTDCMIIADATADALTVAADLVAQAEHGPTSPVWLVTDDAALAGAVAGAVPGLIAALPEPNRSAAAAAWAGRGEIVICDNAEEMAAHADATAPEHLHVQAADPDWWRDRLRVYGSLFLGAATTVAFGDKAAGTNHVLPTSGAARYTGGLSVHKFLKVVTWQQVTAPALRELADVTARISRAEGMEGHARSAEARLAMAEPLPRPAPAIAAR